MMLLLLIARKSQGKNTMVGLNAFAIHRIKPKYEVFTMAHGKKQGPIRPC